MGSHKARRFSMEVAAELRQVAIRQAQKLKAEERERLRRLHWRHCPACGMTMDAIFVREVEFLRCFHCGGSFLDHGKLERLAGQDPVDAWDTEPTAITNLEAWYDRRRGED